MLVLVIQVVSSLSLTGVYWQILTSDVTIVVWSYWQEYKPPCSKDIPIDFRMELLKNATNPPGILGSKGELPSVFQSSLELIHNSMLETNNCVRPRLITALSVWHLTQTVWPWSLLHIMGYIVNKRACSVPWTCTIALLWFLFHFSCWWASDVYELFCPVCCKEKQ